MQLASWVYQKLFCRSVRNLYQCVLVWCMKNANWLSPEEQHSLLQNHRKNTLNSISCLVMPDFYNSLLLMEQIAPLIIYLYCNGSEDLERRGEKKSCIVHLKKKGVCHEHCIGCLNFFHVPPNTCMLDARYQFQSLSHCKFAVYNGRTLSMVFQK